MNQLVFCQCQSERLEVVMTNIEMVIDSINVAMIDYQRVVILKEKDGERCLPMWIGATEANAIATARQSAYTSEILTHDFICSIIRKLGADFKYVVVHELKEETYHAKALLEREGGVIEIDCRPSDAFATAIRADTPIFVTEEVLEKAGIFTSEISNMIQEAATNGDD